MTKKDRKKKLRGVLAFLEPEKKQEILAKNVEEDIKDFSKRLAGIKDSSNDVFDLQISLEVLRNGILQKISELPTYESLNEMREAYTTLLKYVETGLTSSLALLKKDLSEISDKVSKGVSSTKVEDLERRILEIGSRGGGSIPLQVSAGGSVANKVYAEINFVGATASTNQTTRKTDITIPSSGSSIFARDSFNGDGSTTVFTVSHIPIVNSDSIYFNGNRQISGTDYSLSGTTLTLLLVTPGTGDVIEAQYAY